jgi:hypothetical protein
VPGNSEVLLEPDLAEYPQTLPRRGERFDIIVVDGPARGRTRLKCSREAVKALNAGGLIILDNSDWLPESAKLLREHGLLQVDMTGFAPICGHVQTTSLFFDRTFSVAPKTGRQPTPGKGSRPSNWETPYVAVPGAVVESDSELFRDAMHEQTVRYTTPGGMRSFHTFSYLALDNRRAIGIVDLDRDRVLLTGHLQGDVAEHERELRRIAALTWDEFRALIGNHQYRRYVL